MKNKTLHLNVNFIIFVSKEMEMTVKVFESNSSTNPNLGGEMGRNQLTWFGEQGRSEEIHWKMP